MDESVTSPTGIIKNNHQKYREPGDIPVKQVLLYNSIASNMLGILRTYSVYKIPH